MEAYAVSLLKAWFGDAATQENDYCFDYLPRLTGDHSIYPAVMGMVDGWCKGFFVMGENPAVGAEAVLREVGGWDENDDALSSYLPLKADGSTRCGCWIYAGCYKDEVNQTARRKPHYEQDWVALEWAWAWPMNRRIIYNRASADPEGKKYIWWDEEQESWTGPDVPDFTPSKSPDYEPPDDARAENAIRGDKPFIMQADGRAWIFVPSGLTDGPFPTHYEPHESPFESALYGQQSNPVRQQFPRPENLYNPSDGQPGAHVFPYVLSTYRLTEHHTAGGMTRTTEHLSELQPEMFCEVSPELAQERGLENGGWATIVTMRAAIEARVLVTDRIAPLQVQGRTLHQVGTPYHWGRKGVVTGDSANDLVGLALDPNVHIGEYKALTCDIQPGRRPRGQALLEFVEDYRRRAEAPERVEEFSRRLENQNGGGES